MMQRLLIALTLLLPVVLSGCLGGNRPLPDPGLEHDDLGIGIHLGMSVSDARAVASRDGVEIAVLTREELNKRSPYADRADADLVVALYTPAPEDSAQHLRNMSYNTITELRCYLAPPGTSQVKLLGKGAAGLSPDAMVGLLGEPLRRSVDSNGAEHLSFHFTPVDEGSAAGCGQLIEVMASHGVIGECFALSLAYSAVMPKL